MRSQVQSKGRVFRPFSLLLVVCYGCLISPLQAKQCQNVSLQILGSGGPEMNDGRASSSYLVWWRNKAHLLVDLGSGSSVNFELAGANIVDLKAILLSHLHIDHSQDLPAYIKASYFTRRSEELLILGPGGNRRMPSTQAYVHRLLGKGGAFAYMQNYLVAEQSSPFKLKVKNVSTAQGRRYSHTLDPFTTLHATEVEHGPNPALAWRVEINGCSLVFSGDTSNLDDKLTHLATGADLLVAHHAIPEHARGVARNLHMPPSEIANTANQAGIKTLILSHHMNRSIAHKEQSLKIIKHTFKGHIVWAEDKMIITP